MKRFTVRHATTYRYAQPVMFGPHRLMVRPRDSHDLRLVDAELMLSPPGETRWMHDVFGNSVAQVEFFQPASELMIVSTLHIERYGPGRSVFPIAPEAQLYPFVYSSGDRSDLGRLLDRHYPDARGLVEEWTKRFVKGRFMSTYNLLSNIHGATHAWADVYLPGAGWVEYDPTNGLIAGENLIRIAVTRDPSQAIPISGAF